MAKAKKPAAKQQDKKSDKSKAPSSAPVIDTAAAAASAAAIIAGGVSTSQDAPVAKKESAMFKQMKQGLNKPALGGVLDKTGSANKKSGAPFGHGFKQVGHNQTFGSDITRTGVPRRTGG